MADLKKLLRVFVADVDTPIGRSVSRHLSHTTIGSLLPQPEVEHEALPTEGADGMVAEEGEAAARPRAEEGDAKGGAARQMSKVPTYTVWGSLSEHPVDEVVKPKTATKPRSATPSSWSFLVEPAEAQRRKGALSKVDVKIAEPGVKPDWVEQTIDASERHLLKQSLMDADVIVYDIMQNLEEAQFALQFLQDTAKNGNPLAAPSSISTAAASSTYLGNLSSTLSSTPASASSALYNNMPSSALTSKDLAPNVAPKKKIFIAVSHLLTWARTLPLAKAYPDEEATEEEEMAVLESEYKRRKCHPVYKNQLAFERELIKAAQTSDALDCYVINSGVRYGPGTHCLEQLLRMAWSGTGEVECYGDEKNELPLIHLDDLAQIVAHVIEYRPQSKYVIAVDESNTQYGVINQVIADQLGDGRVRLSTYDGALHNHLLSPFDRHCLSINLKIEGDTIKQFTQMEWKYKNGFVQNAKRIIHEFIEAHHIAPLRIVLHGPPGVGKKSLAHAVSDFYDIPYVNQTVMFEHFESDIKNDQLAKEATASRPASAGSNSSPVESAQQSVTVSTLVTEEDRQVYQQWQEAVAASQTPSVDILRHIFQRYLKRPVCINRGWVTDNLDFDSNDVRTLFRLARGPAAEGNEGETEPEENANPEEKWDELDEDGMPTKRPVQANDILPHFVFALEASDATLQAVIAKNKHDQSKAQSRLAQFKAFNNDESSSIDFFEENEIHAISLAITESTTESDLLDSVKVRVGKPRHFGPSEEEMAEMKKQAGIRRAEKAKVRDEVRAQNEALQQKRHAAAVAEWNARIDELRQQEKAMLEAQSLPLRTYMMKHIMPTLSQALIEVCKVRPEDPIDFLAEYLFRANVANETPAVQDGCEPESDVTRNAMAS